MIQNEFTDNKCLILILLSIQFYKYADVTTPNVSLTEPTSFVTDVVCGKDVIAVIVQRKGELRTIAPELVMFHNNSSCFASENRNQLQLQIDLRNHLCGSDIVKLSSNRILLRNEVVYVDVAQAKVYSLRNISCLYMNGKNVDLLSSAYKHAVFENQKFSLNLLKGGWNFNHSKVEEFSNVLVKDFLVVDIQSTLLSYYEETQKLLVRSCFASWSSNPYIDVERRHYLIIDGCPPPSDPTVEILSSPQFRFRFQMFMWVNIEVQRIYIFCNISSCSQESTKNASHDFVHSKKEINCIKICPKSNSEVTPSTNEVFNEPQKKTNYAVFGFGPVFPVKSSNFIEDELSSFLVTTKSISIQTTNESKGLSSSYLTGIFSGVGFLFLCIIVFTLLRYRATIKCRSKKKEKKNEKIQTGFSFALRSSNDVWIKNEKEIDDSA